MVPAPDPHRGRDGMFPPATAQKIYRRDSMRTYAGIFAITKPQTGQHSGTGSLCRVVHQSLKLQERRFGEALTRFVFAAGSPRAVAFSSDLDTKNGGCDRLRPAFFSASYAFSAHIPLLDKANAFAQHAPPTHRASCAAGEQLVAALAQRRTAAGSGGPCHGLGLRLQRLLRLWWRERGRPGAPM